MRKIAPRAERAKRDQEILRLRKAGLYPAQIAEQLGVTRAIVKVTLRQLGAQVGPEERASPAYQAWRSARAMAPRVDAAAAKGGYKRHQAAALLARGYSVALIAQALKLPNRRAVWTLLFQARQEAKRDNG